MKEILVGRIFRKNHFGIIYANIFYCPRALLNDSRWKILCNFWFDFIIYEFFLNVSTIDRYHDKVENVFLSWNCAITVLRKVAWQAFRSCGLINIGLDIGLIKIAVTVVCSYVRMFEIFLIFINVEKITNRFKLVTAKIVYWSLTLSLLLIFNRFFFVNFRSSIWFED